MPFVRCTCALLLPGGLVVLAGLAMLRPTAAADPLEPHIRALAVLLLVAGVWLGWYYSRSRIPAALLLLGIAEETLRWLGGAGTPPGAPGRTIVAALAVLLPLNLAAYSVLPERGLLTARSLRWLVPVPGQIIGVGLIVRLEGPAGTAWLGQRFGEGPWLDWTAIPQAAVAAFALAGLFLIVRYLQHRDPVDAGFLWAEVSAFLALDVFLRGWAPTAYFTAAGLVLVASLVQTSYRIADYDALTDLPARRAMTEALLQARGRHVVALLRLDHFTRLEKTFGREVGNQVLRMVAAQLRRVSGGGTAFRYGGETFAVLFGGTTAEEAIPHLEAVRRAIASYCFVLRGPGRPRFRPAAPLPPTGPRVAVAVTVSIGAAEGAGQPSRPRRVIRAARAALRQAIRAGRNQTVV